MLMWSPSENASVQVTPIQSDNLDEKFETLQMFLQNNISIAHRLTSPCLVGVKMENTGFTKTEYDEALEIFKTNVIVPFQKELSYSLSTFLNKTITL